MEPGPQPYSKVRRCLRCGKEIDEGCWLCDKCRNKNKLIEEIHFYVPRYPCKRYWVYQD